MDAASLANLGLIPAAPQSAGFNLADLFLNQVLIVSGLVWLIAQTTKYITSRLNGRHDKFLDSGGMPSSHAAVVTCAATVIGLSQGLASPLFGLAVILCAIVLYDACRVRHMAGETAERVNGLLKKGRHVTVHRGHTVAEVAVGSAFGVALGAAFYLSIFG